VTGPRSPRGMARNLSASSPMSPIPTRAPDCRPQPWQEPRSPLLSEWPATWSAQVKSLAEPGGNVTGMLFSVPKQDRKRLEGLMETVPCVPVVAFPFGTGTRTLRYRDQGETVLTGLDDSNGFLTRPKSFDRPVSALYPLHGVIRRRVPYGWEGREPSRRGLCRLSGRNP
jgi:hypothetical protein